MKNQFISSFKVIEEKDLLVEVQTGVIDLEVMKKYQLFRNGFPELFHYKNVVLFIDELDLDLLINHLDNIVSFYSTLNRPVDKMYRIAAIIKTPHQMVYAKGFKEHVSPLIQYEFFYSVSEAILWLGNIITEKEINKIKRELKRKPLFEISY